MKFAKSINLFEKIIIENSTTLQQQKDAFLQRIINVRIHQ